MSTGVIATSRRSEEPRDSETNRSRHEQGNSSANNLSSHSNNTMNRLTDQSSMQPSAANLNVNHNSNWRSLQDLITIPAAQIQFDDC